MLELLGDAVSRVGVAISESLNTAIRQIPAKQYETQLRAAMRHEWWPGLQALRALRHRLKGGPEAIGAENAAMQWYMLGHTFLRLNEEKERKRHEREASRRCSRMACTYHRRVPDQAAGIEMKACTGCREVRYCGRDCQMKYACFCGSFSGHSLLFTGIGRTPGPSVNESSMFGEVD